MPETTANLTNEVITTDQAIERADADCFLLSKLADHLSVMPTTEADLQLDEAVSVTLQSLHRDRYRSAAADPLTYIRGGDTRKACVRDIAGAASIDFVLNRVEDNSRVDGAVTALDLEHYAKQLTHSRICRTKAGALGLIIESLEFAQIRTMTTEESNYTNGVLHQLRANKVSEGIRLVGKSLAVGLGFYVVQKHFRGNK